jgi:RecA-family ATPase
LSKVPSPSRIVASSANGKHAFFSISKKLPPSEVELSNKALTQAVGGDHSQSTAKKFRLPGSPNYKHDPPYIVRVAAQSDIVHDADKLLRWARSTLDQSAKPKSEKDYASRGKPARRMVQARQLAPMGPKARAIVEKYSRSLDSYTLDRLDQRKIRGSFSFRIGQKQVSYPGDDRSEIIWGIGCALRDAGATKRECREVLTDNRFWKDRELDGKAEDPDELVDKIYDRELEEDEESPGLANPIDFADPSHWSGMDIPPQQWLMEGWIPDLKSTGLYGDGGTGKTTLALQLAVSCAAGLPFLGSPVKQCLVMAFLGENDSSDTQRTLDRVCQAYDVDLSELTDLRIASRAGLGNIWMEFKNGRGRHTKLFDELLEQVKAFKPGLFIAETAADLFGGNENVRTEVRQFIVNCCERIAREAGCAVLICAHPSVAGIRSGAGDGGNTAWNNSFRSRMYLRREISEDGHEDDPDIRILELKKANFAQVGNYKTLSWEEGVFKGQEVEGLKPKPHRHDELIIEQVEEAFRNGDPWSANHQSGRRYLVLWMKQQLRMTERAAKQKLFSLLHAEKLVEVAFDSHRHRKGLCTPEQAKKVRAKLKTQLRNKTL